MSGAPKFDLGEIVGEVQKLYPKDKKSQGMVSLGNIVRREYAAEDGIPVPPSHPLAELVGLPCAPFNKVIQVAGNPDTGKSTFLGELMASAQKAGHIVVLWDSEDKFDAKRFKDQFGGDPDQIVLIKTNEILQGGEKARKLIVAALTKYSQAKLFFCWDSVGGSQSRSHSERELDNERHAQPGQDAKENGAVMRAVVALFNKFPDRIAVVLANQVYAKIGFMQHGDKESGGKKIEFHSSLIIQLKRVKVLTKVVKGKKMKYGIISRATVSKNHLSQSAMSVHQLDFEITATGARLSSEQGTDDDEEVGE